MEPQSETIDNVAEDDSVADNFVDVHAVIDNVNENAYSADTHVEDSELDSHSNTVEVVLHLVLTQQLWENRTPGISLPLMESYICRFALEVWCRDMSYPSLKGSRL